MKLRIEKIELFALLLLTLIGAFVIWTGHPLNYSKDKVVVAFGDSLTVGYGTPPGKNFVTYLSEYTKVSIINSGYTGDTTADALIRLREDVFNYKPDVVMILLGGNDYLKEFSAEATYANIKTIIKQIRNNTKAKIILIGVNREINPKFDAMIDKVANEMKVEGYVPDVLGGILFQKNLLFDNIHPNGKGHELIAKRILPVLEKVLREN